MLAALRIMIRRRFAIMLVSLTTLLPVVVFAGYAVFTALSSYRLADDIRLRSTARALASAVDAELGRYVTALETLAHSPLLDDPVDIDAVEARFRTVAEQLGGWIVLIGQSPGYQMLANTRRNHGSGLPPALPAGSPSTLSDPIAGVFRDGRPAVSDLFIGPVVERTVLAAMVAVDRPGQPRRVLALAFAPERLQALLARQNLPDENFSAIADGQLRVIAFSRDMAGENLGTAAPEWMLAALQDQHSTLVIGPGWRGHDIVYAVERLRQAPRWTVAVAEPLALHGSSGWTALRWALIGGVALGIGMLGVVWANRRATIMEARREADALRAGRAEVERLLGGLPAVIFLREMAPDGSSRRVYRGGDLEAVMGWPTEFLQARNDFDDMAHPEDGTLGQLGIQLLRDGHLSHEWRMRQPDGGWRRLHSITRVLTRRPDGCAEVLGYTIDVTARRAAEERAMAAARMASLGEMAAGLAHEIKQPLQTMSLAADLALISLRRGRSEDIADRLERIIQQALRTGQLIDRLRRFAIGSDQAGEIEDVPLARAIDGALELTRGAIRDAAVAVDVTIGNPSLIVKGNTMLLEQVLSNLLLNARDAVSALPLGAARRIWISSRSEADGSVRLSVADSGGGIAPEVLPRIFEPFVTTKGPDKGTGLGLSICHGLVKRMGGDIEAHNNAEGAVFTITLRAGAACSETSEPIAPTE